MSCWELPAALNVGGKDYPIRYQFGAVLDILAAYNDPDMDDSEKTETMLTILYIDFSSIPAEHLAEAIQKGCEFIDCGQTDDGKRHPKLIDWNQDAGLIIPAVNNVAGCEVRAVPNMHWWTFYGYFMSIGDSLLSSVLHIRKKKAKHQKLEKWESEFYRENKSLIDIKTPESEAVRHEKEAIMNWFSKKR